MVTMTTVTTQHLPRSQSRTRATLARAAGLLPLLIIFLWFAIVVPSDGYLGRARIDMTLYQAMGAHGFQLVAWEREALAEKAQAAAPGKGPRPHLTFRTAVLP